MKNYVCLMRRVCVCVVFSSPSEEGSLKFEYPPASPTILTNIAQALLTLPEFYSQVRRRQLVGVACSCSFKRKPVRVV